MKLRSRLFTAAAAVPLTLGLLALTPAEDAECRLIRGEETPEDVTDDVEVCEATGYFHRSQGVVPVGNLGARAEAGLPSWDENEPTLPVPATYAQLFGTIQHGNPAAQPTFEGTFTGDLDTMQIEMFLSSEPYQNLLGTYPLVFQLSIDGTVVKTYSPDAGSEQDVPMQRVGDGVSKMTFALTGIYDLLDQYFQTGPDVEHTIKLSMGALYFGDGNSVYLFDSTDYASEISFNAQPSNFVTQYDVSG